MNYRNGCKDPQSHTTLLPKRINLTLGEMKTSHKCLYGSFTMVSQTQITTMFSSGWTVTQQYVHTREHDLEIIFKKEKAWDIPHDLLVGCPKNANKPLLVLLLVAQQLDCKILLKT